MSRTIFVATESGAQAQYDQEQVETMLSAGQFAPDTLYWMEGMTEWRPLGEFQKISSGMTPSLSADATMSRPGPGIEGTAFSGYAGFRKRVSAWFLDWVVMVIAFYIVDFAVGVALVAGLKGLSPEELEVWTMSVGWIAGLITGWLYFALMESSSKQATLGKMAINLKVTDLDGRRIGFGRASGRHFAKILSVLILFVGYLMVAFTAKKQGLHDMVAGCLVVRK